MSTPRRQLSVWDAVAVCIGMVIGAGIFQTTANAAAAASSPTMLIVCWIFGGVLSIVGALCYAEMSAAFPDAGGDYFFLRQAYGSNWGFLFAWSRFAVDHSGSMALLAFLFGDYLAQLVPLGAHGNAWYAAMIIVVLIGINLAGIRVGIGTQVVLMAIVLTGLLAVGAAGAWFALRGVPAPPPPVGAATPHAEFGVAMLFIFLSYGGWSDAATLSAEMRDARHGIQRALVIGMLTVMFLYLLVNWALLRGLGLAGLAASEAPAADLMRRAFGRPGEVLIVAIVTVTAVSVINTLLIAGARTTYAAARDTWALRHLGQWHEVRGTPSPALIAIGVVALALVGFGSVTRSGFATMVDYISPVYWFFLTLSGIAVIRLRHRFPGVDRPFRVPWYPWLPLAFVASSLYVLYSSLVYVKLGAVVGVAVLATGALLLLPLHHAERRRLVRS